MLTKNDVWDKNILGIKINFQYLCRMNNAQLNNIIRFSFHFHESMGNKLHEYDPGYILEKWTKYFGELNPNPISDTTHVYLRNYLSKWIDKWGEGSYIVMSKYLSIIHSINTKGFRKYDADYIQRDWLPSELVSIFERSTTKTRFFFEIFYLTI